MKPQIQMISWRYVINFFTQCCLINDLMTILKWSQMSDIGQHRVWQSTFSSAVENKQYRYYLKRILLPIPFWYFIVFMVHCRLYQSFLIPCNCKFVYKIFVMNTHSNKNNYQQRENKGHLNQLWTSTKVIIVLLK